MKLARRVVVPKEASGQDRNEVFHIVDVLYLHAGAVDEVRERLVPDARKRVPDEAHSDVRRNVQAEKHRVEEADGCACVRLNKSLL